MSIGHGEKLSRKMEAAITSLLTSPTIAAAAAATGVSERTLRTWLKMQVFQSAYRAARRQVVEQAVARLQQSTDAAIKTLRRNLSCGHPPTEVRTALGILDQSIRAVELIDMEERLANLERSVACTDTSKR